MKEAIVLLASSVGTSVSVKAMSLEFHVLRVRAALFSFAPATRLRNIEQLQSAPLYDFIPFCRKVHETEMHRVTVRGS